MKVKSSQHHPTTAEDLNTAFQMPLMTYSHQHGRRCLGEQEGKNESMWKIEANTQRPNWHALGHSDHSVNEKQKQNPFFIIAKPICNTPSTISGKADSKERLPFDPPLLFLPVKLGFNASFLHVS